jgi:hypothetical protein
MVSEIEKGFSKLIAKVLHCALKRVEASYSVVFFLLFLVQVIVLMKKENHFLA